MIRTIAFLNTTTYRTRSGGVPRVHQDHGNASQARFVLDLPPQIVKSPGVMLSPLALSNRCPLADTRQVFQGNGAIGAFGLLNNPPGDHVVHILRKAALLAFALSQQTPGGLGALALQSGSQSGVAFSQAVDVPASMDFSLTVGSDADNAQVDAQSFLGLYWLRRFYFTGCQQVERSVYQEQVTLALLGLQQLSLVCPESIGNSLPTVHRPDGDLLLVLLPAQDPAVIGDGALLAEGSFALAVLLVRVCHFGNAAHGHLGRQAKTLAHIIVDQFVQAELPEGLFLPSALANVLTGGIGCVKCTLECISLFGSGQEFDLCSKAFHMASIAQKFYLDNSHERGIAASSSD